ncbi:MAG TPA: DUF1801 domain-containing protein [Clostridia bacterium]|nr:DUF1801 domain-containing protein [Clostridiales bacterium]HOL91142.1 DUF1801 domain-containing protein [Clostridiales bacterium]
MWKCPKCGREFKKEGQHHFCGDASTMTVDEYIEAQLPEIRQILDKVRETIRKVLPDAEERIAYGMPTYRGKRNIIHFAAQKKHLGLYPGDKAIEHFADRLSGYKTSKGAVQFPYDRPIPLDLITEIAQWCRDTGSHH